MKRTIEKNHAAVRRPKFFKELGLQTSYFWGETIHFFLAISKTNYYFQQGGKQFIYFEQNGKHFIYFHIFLNPPPPPRYQMVRPLRESDRFLVLWAVNVNVSARTRLYEQLPWLGVFNTDISIILGTRDHLLNYGSHFKARAFNSPRPTYQQCVWLNSSLVSFLSSFRALFRRAHRSVAVSRTLHAPVRSSST